MQLNEAKFIAEDAKQHTPHDMVWNALQKATMDHAKTKAVHGEDHPDTKMHSKNVDSLKTQYADLVNGTHADEKKSAESDAQAKLLQAKSIAAETEMKNNQADLVGTINKHVSSDPSKVNDVAIGHALGTTQQPQQDDQNPIPGKVAKSKAVK